MQILLSLILSLCVLVQLMAKKNMRFTPLVKVAVVNDVVTVPTIQLKSKWIKFSVYQVRQVFCETDGVEATSSPFLKPS